MRQPPASLLRDRATSPRRTAALCVVSLVIAALSGCAQIRLIPGTKIQDNTTNREIIARCEEYRVAMEQRDAAKLLSMADPNYYEDSGTPSGSDDYGFPGLKRVLETRLSAIRWMRYLIRYRDIHREGDRASVDIRYDISYKIMTEIGEKWERRQNEKRLELRRDGNRWLFLAGY